MDSKNKLKAELKASSQFDKVLRTYLEDLQNKFYDTASALADAQEAGAITYLNKASAIKQILKDIN